METIYNCEHWKKEFREAAFRKLRGENSEFIKDKQLFITC